LGYKTPLEVIQEWKKLKEKQYKITYSHVA
jgi:hypothetical protein